MKPKKTLIFILILFFLSGMGVVDFWLPVAVTSYGFYLIPVCAAAWFLGLRSALFICLLSTGIWIGANPELLDLASSFLISTWNILVRFTTFVLFAFVINRLRTALQDKDDLIRRLRRSLTEAQTQEHVYPVCQECGNIRLGKDHWVGVNQFLSRKTDRDFATTFCNHCLEEKRPSAKPDAS